MSDTKKSSSHERKAESYLTPANHNYIANYVSTRGGSVSGAINDAVHALREKTGPISSPPTKKM